MMKDVLLVEGKSDVAFFSAVLRELEMPDVRVEPPETFELPNTVTVVANRLLPLLFKQQDEGKVRRIAVVVDADHDSGGGFQNRWKELTDAFRSHGYRPPTRPPTEPCRGSRFVHSDGLEDAGLWLMPDHHRNGMLEDLVLDSVVEEQMDLLTHARKSISTLPRTLFSRHHTSKAVVYSWLCYQTRPALGLGAAVREPALARESGTFFELVRWLRDFFT